MPRTPRASDRTRRWLRNAKALGIAAGVAWGVELADHLLLRQRLDQWGIVPRRAGGLLGIPLAPLLHGGFDHVAANTLPFLILGWLVLLGSVRQFVIVSALAVLVSGLGVWLLGPNDTTHVGASGLIFGYFGFLVVRAYFERSAVTFLIAGLAVLLYGGLFLGVLPSAPNVSWVGHLFGFVGGVVAAKMLARPGSK